MKVFKTAALLFVVFTLLFIASFFWQIHHRAIHFIADLLTLLIAGQIFITAWFTRKYSEHPLSLFIGATYFTLAIVFICYLTPYYCTDSGKSINQDLQIWGLSRFLESAGLLIALFCVNAKIKPLPVFGLGFTIAILMAIGLFSGHFPDCLTAENKSTLFKTILGFTIIIVKYSTLVLLIKNKKSFDDYLFNLLIWSICFSTAANVLFIFIESTTLPLYPFGEIFILVSNYLILKVLIDTSIEIPIDSLFRQFKLHEDFLVKAKLELEKKVAASIMELNQKNRELQSEVAEKKSKGNALRSSEERFRVILKNLKIIVAHCDRELRYTWIHDPYGIFNTQRTLGCTDIELTPMEGSRLIMELKKSVIENGVGMRKEIKLGFSGGEKIFDTTAEPLYDENANITGVTTVAVDITEKKKVEETLNMRHSVLESIYSIATSPKFLKDTIYNQIVLSIAKLLNVPFVSIIKNITNDKVSNVALFNSESECLELSKEVCNQSAFNCINKKSIIYKKYSHENSCFCNCLKNNRAQVYMGIPILSDAGNCLGIICILDTKAHEFSSEQIQIVEIFSRYVANEFERAIIQKELIQSQEMKILGILTSGVAHEVRNPLNAIWAITEALFQEIKDLKNLTIYKDHIKTQVERLTLLMKELLDFGKPFSFNDSSLVSIPLLCKKTIELWNQSKNTNHTVTFKNSSANDEGLIKGDFTKFQQVLINLLDNASQHSDEEKEITVHYYRKIASVHIEVIDRGHGITETNRAKIFDPFFTTRAKGTGLGLPIVKHIVETHQGTIDIYCNDPPPGVTAAIVLPAADVKKEPDLNNKITLSNTA